MEWPQLLIRVIVTYLFLMLFSRMVGKKIISQMTFFDFIAGVTFGSLGGSIILTGQISLMKGIVALAAFSLLAIGTDWLTLKSRKLRKWFNGKEDLIIINGVIDRKALERSRVTVDDLLMQLRKKNVFYLDEVSYAFLEKDGTITVQKKGNLLPVTVQDMSLVAAERGVPRLLYLDGYPVDEPVKSPIKPDITIDMIREQYGGEIDPDEILIAQADQNGRIFISRGDERDKMNRAPQ
ncbi:DUF421 domain-containing protein [Paenibacillus tarimensis]|uniref:DUF421 domain-containing protein n=1 Tax=Paenibacillus tarimensis TaxID=416012 RepID=UPI001F24FF3E|nr:DUF421 domain-containing protein [Paenibacillus tarimensis]MCF2945547.1 DUF421 domain-containing protein [Paenibacillus tarimensis]